MTWDLPEFKIIILAINPLMLTYTIRPNTVLVGTSTSSPQQQHPRPPSKYPALVPKA